MMPLRRNTVSESNYIKNFWDRKTKSIFVQNVTFGIDPPLSEERVTELVSQFAKEFPEDSVSIKKAYVPKGMLFNRREDLDTITLKITLKECDGKNITFSFRPKDSYAVAYVTYKNNQTSSDTEIKGFRFNCNLEATLKKLSLFIKKYPQYQEEALNAYLTKEKENKIVDMAEKSIQTIVPQIMANSGYEWILTCEETRYILSIKMKKHKMIKISLTAKNFAEKISGILEVVAQIDNLLEKIPFTVDIKTYGSNIQWKKGNGT